MSAAKQTSGIVIGRRVDAPSADTPGLNGEFKRGDIFVLFCRIQQGGGWWCGPYKVNGRCGNQPTYRAKWGKVDKVATTWIIQARAAISKGEGA